MSVPPHAVAISKPDLWSDIEKNEDNLRKLEGLGAVEGNSVASLALRGGVGARKSGLFGSLCLSIGFC